MQFSTVLMIRHSLVIFLSTGDGEIYLALVTQDGGR